MSTPAEDVIEKYGLTDDMALNAITNFWGYEVACELLCEAIDRNQAGEDFAEFIEENFGEAKKEIEIVICDKNASHDARSSSARTVDEIIDDDSFLRQLQELEDNSSKLDERAIHTKNDSLDSGRLPFWKWKAQVILKVLEHPAMARNANPRSVPDFDSPSWEADFLSGMTVEQEYEKANEAFNKMGW